MCIEHMRCNDIVHQMTEGEDSRYNLLAITEGTGRPGWLIGSFGYILLDFLVKTGPDGSGRPLGFIWAKFQTKRSILDPFHAIFDDLGPN